jgi:hypothetical protein
VNSLELDSVIVQARLGSARLLYKLGSTRLGYCTSSTRARLSSTRLGSFTGLIMSSFGSHDAMSGSIEEGNTKA